MNTKRQRIVTLALCIVFIFVTFASLFYIVKEEKHSCTDKDCPICACLHQAEQTLKNAGTAVAVTCGLSAVCLFCMEQMTEQGFFVVCYTLVSQKVRLDN